MRNIITFSLLLSLITISASAVQAQIRVDDGIRSPRSVVIGGSSVIDNEMHEMIGGDFGQPSILSAPVDPSIIAPSITLPENSIMPIDPSPPSEPRKGVKRVVKPHDQIKIRRSIQDERIDDYYVQELVKDNYLFESNR